MIRRAPVIRVPTPRNSTLVSRRESVEYRKRHRQRPSYALCASQQKQLMKSTKNTSSGQAILVTPDDLTHLEDFLKKHFSELAYSVTCEDGTRLEPTNLQDILDYENPTFRRIATIVIVASDGTASGDRTEISIGKVGIILAGTQSISFRFADVKRQQPIEEEVILRLRAMRPWFWWLSRIPFYVLLPAALVGMSFFLNAASIIRKLRAATASAPTSPSLFTESEGQTMTVVSIVALLVIGSILDRFRDYLFPRCFFLIGRQVKEYGQRKTISSIIFGVIILGILINIASSLIYQPK